MSTRKPQLGIRDEDLGPDGRPIIKAEDPQKVDSNALGRRTLVQVPTPRLRPGSIPSRKS
jgi:hypothetical protein